MLIKILNLTSFRCPDTMIYLKKNIKYIQFPEIVLIISNDISTTWDIPLFCNFMNYKLIKKYIKTKPYQFLIQKKKEEMLHRI
ncbi:sulfurtransferase TusA family protein [Buchnera aphidicola]|uniref:sulfurtransferase TusA family protein n=1 Tax=Buchnera aphidicola TaxID=9 RepID=UPI0034644AE0